MFGTALRADLKGPTLLALHARKIGLREGQLLPAGGQMTGS